mgnify:FL=1
MKTKEEKKKIIEELIQLFEKSKKVFFICLLNINSEIQNSLRNQIKKAGGAFKVVKKNLLRLANKNLDLEKNEFKVPLGVIFDFNDLNNIEIFKMLTEFNKTKNLILIAALVGNRTLTPEEIIYIGQLPPREILVQKYNSLLKSLLGILFFTLKNPLIKLNLVVNNIKKK